MYHYVSLSVMLAISVISQLNHWALTLEEVEAHPLRLSTLQRLMIVAQADDGGPGWWWLPGLMMVARADDVYQGWWWLPGLMTVSRADDGCLCWWWLPGLMLVARVDDSCQGWWWLPGLMMMARVMTVSRVDDGCQGWWWLPGLIMVTRCQWRARSNGRKKRELLHFLELPFTGTVISCAHLTTQEA